ncbi:ABC transporter ATP-binding protein [Litoribacter ruber]|uniref:ABC transporter ATP-binding protein n=1 Tax=Litoribacter ruber TaxID=702568 RepID=UPI001BD9476B|nr:ABC transporter ATP-binding protein [Litoribacter ruber]MBT0812232.1 ABC transporter ATP-binding protein [Litoribacter ruber]
MDSTVIKTERLSKFYGSEKALDNVSIEINKGEIIGIVGPNGSGKSTLINILLGLRKPSSGNFTILGSTSPDTIQSQIGVVMDQSCFYLRVSAKANLVISAKTKGVGEERVEELLKLVGLDHTGAKRFQDFSYGMRKRLEIADALLTDPKLIIMDEPTNGLDPQGIIFVRNLIRQFKEEGKTVIIASHYMEELEKLCTGIIFLKDGAVALQDTTENLLRDHFSIEKAFTSTIY